MKTLKNKSVNSVLSSPTRAVFSHSLHASPPGNTLVAGARGSYNFGTEKGRINFRGRGGEQGMEGGKAVSYTHLTLPTKRIV